MKSTEQSGYAIFDTAIGFCGISWSEKGITAFQLPERNQSMVRARLERRRPGAPPAMPPHWVAALMERIKSHLVGETQDFSSVPIDWGDLPDFHRAVYQAAQAIPSGKVLTYGELAKRVRSPKAARAVGQALGRNPIALIVPCHRVVAAGRKPGGFSAFGGLSMKARLLGIEGLELLRC